MAVVLGAQVRDAARLVVFQLRDALLPVAERVLLVDATLDLG